MEKQPKTCPFVYSGHTPCSEDCQLYVYYNSWGMCAIKVIALMLQVQGEKRL